MIRKIEKVLVANRGEIAVRIIRSLKEMGILTVAIYSDMDRDSLHVRISDESICIGPRDTKESYLDKVKILNAAMITGCDAIHPGFGFLSENSGFAKMCEIYNIKFIGPSSRVISIMGNKELSKKMMKEAGIPVIPGSDNVIKDISEAKKIARSVLYPVILKSRSGGGGKGMRVVFSENELEENYVSAKKEAKAAFGDDGIYIEKYIERAKHIEVQILGDEYGNIVHLGARNCSLQINYQKIIEEAPPTGIEDEIIQMICDMAVKACRYSGYSNAGTVEFLLTDNNEIYFIEMNTRIQVEHPVTEMVTGIDIVKEQIKIARHEKLRYSQKDIRIQGHAIECRINACSPENGFMPSTGEISIIHMPGGYGIRIDSGIFSGYRVLPFYDSMMAKIISHGKNRDESIEIMNRALEEIQIGGLNTNCEFNRKVLKSDFFRQNRYYTSSLKEFLNTYLKSTERMRIRNDT